MFFKGLNLRPQKTLTFYSVVIGRKFFYCDTVSEMRFNVIGGTIVSIAIKCMFIDLRDENG